MEVADKLDSDTQSTTAYEDWAGFDCERGVKRPNLVKMKTGAAGDNT